MFIEPEPKRMNFRSGGAKCAVALSLLKGAKRIQENHGAINISPRWGEGKLWIDAGNRGPICWQHAKRQLQTHQWLFRRA